MGWPLIVTRPFTFATETPLTPGNLMCKGTGGGRSGAAEQFAAVRLRAAPSGRVLCTSLSRGLPTHLYSMPSTITTVVAPCGVDTVRVLTLVIGGCLQQGGEADGGDGPVVQCREVAHGVGAAPRLPTASGKADRRAV